VPIVTTGTGGARRAGGGAPEGGTGGGELSRPLFARILARSAAIEARKGGTAHRERLLSGLEGTVVEVGAGTGNNFALYPPGVTRVLAVEPETNLRALAVDAARTAPVPVHVVSAVGDHLPLGDHSVDAVVVAGVLCSVPQQARTLAELARVVRPGGELRFYEHVAAANPAAAAVQRLLGATVWPRMMGGCDPTRDTAAAVAAAGFAVEELERFTFWPTTLSIPVAPRILGRARRP
jgi:ubiquinone/menaquinone biosynthesis C-methylase UbiE